LAVKLVAFGTGEVLRLLGIWRGASFAMSISNGLGSPAKEHPMATRLPASQHTREELTALIEGRLSVEANRPASVELSHGRMILHVRPGGTSKAKQQAIVEGWHREQLRKAVPPLIKKCERLIGVIQDIPSAFWRDRCSALANVSSM